MNFSERISKSFANNNIEYGLFEITDGKEKIISKSTNKESLNEQKDKLKLRAPKYVVRRISNLWSFSSFNVDPIELTSNQVLDSLLWLSKNSMNKSFSIGCNKLYNEFSKLCKGNDIINFSEEFDSSNVDTKWTPPEGMFSDWSAEDIAKEIHKSHESLKSAMACLNFYLNRGGDNVPENRKKVIENAKELIRDMYK